MTLHTDINQLIVDIEELNKRCPAIGPFEWSAEAQEKLSECSSALMELCSENAGLRNEATLRSRTITIREEVYEDDFPGCTATNHAECACANWEPPACNACGDSIKDGEAFCWYEDIDIPWLAADDPDQSTSFFVWHVKCESQ